MKYIFVILGLVLFTLMYSVFSFKVNPIDIESATCYASLISATSFARIVQVEKNSLLYQEVELTYDVGLERRNVVLRSIRSFKEEFELIDCVGGL